MDYQDVNRQYDKGKQIISISVTVISIVGLIFDAIIYNSYYSVSQEWVQWLTILWCAIALAFSLARKKHYVLAYGMVAYGVIVNIVLTNLFAYFFVAAEDFTSSSAFSRDVFFIILYIVLSGFIVGRNHIFIQGLILLNLLFYFIFVIREKFFIENAAMYIVTVAGFLFVLYFLVGTLNNLIKGLEESTIHAHDLKQTEINKNQTLYNYQNSLLLLAKDEPLLNTSLDLLFRRICSTAAQNLNTSRVSVWILEENNTRLVRRHLCEMSQGTDECVVMERKDFPVYFRALETEPFILARDASEHPYTKEFRDAYLKPLSIFSMLDCTIVIDGKAIGVICCENQYSYKDWSTEEVLFIQSLSGYISICYKNHEIRDLLNQVRRRNEDLLDKSDEIEAMNKVLNSLNESLEATVRERTIELETQNKQLTEYAFVNSHILRAPLARILGLAHLISNNSASIRDKELLNALIQSSNELDSIIRKISELLYDGNNLSRKDIKTMIDKHLNEN